MNLLSLFVCFKGRSGRRQAPPLPDESYPLGTAEHKVLRVPVVKRSATPLRCIGDPDQRHGEKSGKVQLSLYCTDSLGTTGPTASYPMSSLYLQLLGQRARLCSLIHQERVISDTSLARFSQNRLFWEKQTRWYRGWLGLVPVLVRPQISSSQSSMSSITEAFRRN